MKSLNKLIFVAAVTLFVSACSEKPDIENTSTVKMSGEWFVQTFGDGQLAADFGKILTYNTSDPNSGQIWLDDLHNTWVFKGKFEVDYLNLSFKPKAGIENLYATGETIEIMEGKIIPNGGHSKTGVVVDSIYLKAKFSDDPDDLVWELKGHHRTGFFEDEY